MFYVPHLKGILFQYLSQTENFTLSFNIVNSCRDEKKRWNDKLEVIFDKVFYILNFNNHYRPCFFFLLRRALNVFFVFKMRTYCRET